MREIRQRVGRYRRLIARLCVLSLLAVPALVVTTTLPSSAGVTAVVIYNCERFDSAGSSVCTIEWDSATSRYALQSPENTQNVLGYMCSLPDLGKYFISDLCKIANGTTKLAAGVTNTALRFLNGNNAISNGACVGIFATDAPVYAAPFLAAGFPLQAALFVSAVPFLFSSSTPGCHPQQSSTTTTSTTTTSTTTTTQPMCANPPTC